MAQQMLPTDWLVAVYGIQEPNELVSLRANLKFSMALNADEQGLMMMVMAWPLLF